MSETNSFTAKKLKATIVLVGDSTTVFPGTGKNTLIVEGLRMSANVNATAQQATQMSLNIWGLREVDMDALTVAFQTFGAIRQNTITLEADCGDGYRLVFQGNIIEAQPDFRRAPEVCLQILGMTGYFESINTADALSFQGAVDIDVYGRYFADKLEMSYLNVGVKATLNNRYYAGSVFDQLRNVAIDAKIDFYLQGKTLVFAPQRLTQELTDQPAVILSPTSGLLGYPMYSRQGLIVTAIYNPAFQCASAIEIKDSHVKAANGRWFPFSMELELTSNLPGGKWDAVMQCNKGGQ